MCDEQRRQLLAGLLGGLALVCLRARAGEVVWEGPQSGPARQPGRIIRFISQDFRNGGITAVYRGLQEAALRLGWMLDIEDGSGSPDLIRRAFRRAVRQRVDAVVLGGFDEGSIADLIPAEAGPVLVGWHSGTRPGATAHLFVNVSTDPADVAAVAAGFVAQSRQGRAGVVIFNDHRFEIANFKTRQMVSILRQTPDCEVLSVEDIAISRVSSEVPAAVLRLNADYGSRWTHSLAINDAYFDFINSPLASIGRRDIVNIAAGDGSFIALSRIRSGVSQQVATVAEPSGIQGWQLADEMNRAFAGKPPSGYVSQPILVTTQTLRRQSRIDIDADIPYRKRYTEIWGVPLSVPRTG